MWVGIELPVGLGMVLCPCVGYNVEVQQSTMLLSINSGKQGIHICTQPFEEGLSKLHVSDCCNMNVTCHFLAAARHPGVSSETSESERTESLRNYRLYNLKFQYRLVNIAARTIKCW
ncbi:hypothetical protein PGTUg99_036694 [Puccinia graminis f. sp. tritici]|uniref:Uncharacterized protein n=1 Tax=Puccinia graminis f. sp. tritici TaxID=56615 RepID=A0A5B0QW87_PUCGR|nr:hypothetical protein PGTUg99_036694 [Puccinia graminis f. sp. tritici]